MSSKNRSQNVASSTPEVPVVQRSLANERILEAAHKHLDVLFDRACNEQIDGRAFYGHIILDIPFVGGAAQEIKSSQMATDRVRGGPQ